MNLEQHLARQLAFSAATFGPGQRMEGVLDHLTKEIEEVRESNGSADEWVDLVILSLDGLLRQIKFCLDDNSMVETPYNTVVAKTACMMIEGKQNRNENRTWPDWRTADPNKAIEHDRSKD